MYFLDTNTCIDFLRSPKSPVQNRLLSISADEIQIPAIVKAELLTGAYKSKYAETLEKTELFLSQFEIVPFIDNMTHTYAKIRSNLEKQGCAIGANDMFIAATALYYGVTLVTHNTKEFARITDLKLDDWNI